MARNRKRADSYNLETERVHTSLRPKGYTAAEAHKVLRQDYNQKKGAIRHSFRAYLPELWCNSASSSLGYASRYRMYT